jgi:hypothetical protein
MTRAISSVLSFMSRGGSNLFHFLIFHLCFLLLPLFSYSQLFTFAFLLLPSITLPEPASPWSRTARWIESPVGDSDRRS